MTVVPFDKKDREETQAEIAANLKTMKDFSDAVVKLADQSGIKFILTLNVDKEDIDEEMYCRVHNTTILDIAATVEALTEKYPQALALLVAKKMQGLKV